MTRHARAIAKKPVAAARQWLTVAALLAFFLQSLAVQTHIHPADMPAVAKVAVSHQPTPAPLKGQDPIDQCRLCHELVQAGAFIAPSLSLLPASLAFVPAVFAPQPRLADATATAFAWQSRAPPRH